MADTQPTHADEQLKAVAPEGDDFRTWLVDAIREARAERTGGEPEASAHKAGIVAAYETALYAYDARQARPPVADNAKVPFDPIYGLYSPPAAIDADLEPWTNGGLEDPEDLCGAPVHGHCTLPKGHAGFCHNPTECE